jgi:phospholipid/cholesterol/gamma-HCH transport system substrate-binding protein
MERSTLDLWVGLFVVGGVVALVLLAFKVGNLGTYNVSETYELQAYFANIGGLKPTAGVRSAGVLVGRVKDISLDTNRFEAKVTMTIDKRYQFDQDTYAKVLTSGLLGEQYIGLSVGGDSEMLKPGDTIRHTQSAMVLEDLIGKVINMVAEGGSKPKEAK